MRHYHLFPFVMAALMLNGTAVLAETAQPQDSAQSDVSDYWHADVPEDLITSTQWSFDPSEIYVEGYGDLVTLSVSPSGQYIAATDSGLMDLPNKNAAGVYNPYGMLSEAIFLFSKEGDHYLLDETYPIDTESQLELSSMLGGSSTLSWNEDETCIIIESNWGIASPAMTHTTLVHSNLYLLNLSDGSFQCLTSNDDMCEHSVLAQWLDADTISYAQIYLTPDKLWRNEVHEISLTTGEDTKLADLYDAEGRVCPILSLQVCGDQIYYTVDAMGGVQTGFFKSPVGGSAADAQCLVDLTAELRDTQVHPYCRSMQLCQPGISADGKWACLILYDYRIVNKDIPLSDDPQNPQSDPANAISIMTKQPWVPCHNILLYDLEAEQLAEPFESEIFDPAKVIVTGACFAPDGKSLLCAVFGDGGPSTMADYNRVTFYQVDLTDGNYTSVRVYETELASGHWFYSGFSWLSQNILCIPTGTPPLYAVQLMKPAAF